MRFCLTLLALFAFAAVAMANPPCPNGQCNNPPQQLRVFQAPQPQVFQAAPQAPAVRFNVTAPQVQLETVEPSFQAAPQVFLPQAPRRAVQSQVIYQERRVYSQPQVVYSQAPVYAAPQPVFAQSVYSQQVFAAPVVPVVRRGLVNRILFGDTVFAAPFAAQAFATPVVPFGGVNFNFGLRGGSRR